MAIDHLLLEEYPDPNTIRFRTYGWSKPAWTFGYSQKWSPQHNIISKMSADLIRRPTGGGLVDHLNDWTYSLVIPKQHPLCRANARISYLKVHEALQKALINQNCNASLKPCPEACSEIEEEKPKVGATKKGKVTAVCFASPEIYDVVHPSGQKIAGAAQKRSRNGLLIQGSINRQSAGEINWDTFRDDFSRNLSELLDSRITYRPMPDFSSRELYQLTRRYRSIAWNKKKVRNRPKLQKTPDA